MKLLQLFTGYQICKIVAKLTSKNIKEDNFEFNDNQYLIIANHVGFKDPFHIVGNLKSKDILKIGPIRAMTANKYLYRTPYGWLLRLFFGCFPAKEYRNKKYGISASVEYASKKQSIIIFPEGRRNLENQKIQLRTGASVIAQQTRLKVLPVFIKDNKNKSLVIYGKPFDANGMDIESMMQKVWDLKMND